MKLVLYSGGQSRSNARLHEAVVRLARQGKSKKHSLSLTYVPFCTEGSAVFYNRSVRRYRRYGIEHFHCLPVDTDLTKEAITKALSSDVIYLAGGNTFYFLHHLRKSGLLPRLKDFVKKGGVLAGLSAGGLIMSPTVALAGDPGLGPDENEIGVSNFKALHLFDFEFSPHYEPTTKLVKGHIAYSKTAKHPVFAICDGGGVVIEGSDIKVFGRAEIFQQGNRFQLNR